MPPGIYERKVFKTHCKNGHERTPENVLPNKNCRICTNEQRRIKYLKPPTHCKNGHERTPENTGKNGRCLLCKKLQDAEYRVKIADKARAYKAEYYQKDRDQQRAKRRRYYVENSASAKERTRVWNKENPDKRSDNLQKRRAVVKGANLTPVKRSEIFQRDGWVCGLCGLPVDPELRYPHPRSKSLDHIIPLSKGGDHGPHNVQLAHLHCNLRKSDRPGLAY